MSISAGRAAPARISRLPSRPPIVTRIPYPTEFVDRVRALAPCLPDRQIAAQLDQEGLVGAKGKRLTP